MQTTAAKQRAPGTVRKNLARYKYLYSMLIPVVAYYLLFHYYPMYGLTIAFKDFKFSQGIVGSAWAGMKHFDKLFSMNSFWEVFRNTLVISVYKLIFNFPAPIILALLLNELTNLKFKKTVQTISYLPHFLSWVVLGGVFTQLLSPSIGPFNVLLRSLGMDPIFFLGSTKYFRSVLVATSIWKAVGWGSIIYIATLSSIDPELYEAAAIDGANRFHRVRYISLPSLLPVISIMLIFAVGGIVNDDFDQVFNLYNEAVYSVGDVLSTYVYRQGLEQVEYSLSTAAGLFKNIIAFGLIILTNHSAKRLGGGGIW